jgi:NADH dehydrogenase (ubiquinone) 1 alpha subcomplex subunit 9
MYGWEDKLLNNLGSPGHLFTSNSMQEKLWPVHVVDVGQALEHMLYDDTTASQTYELYGPKEYSMADIAELVDREIIKKRRHFNIPKAVRQPLAYYMNKFIWWPVGSAQEVEREFVDQVIDPSAKTFTDLGMEPVDLESMMFQYLVSFTLLYCNQHVNLDSFHIVHQLTTIYLL